MNKRIIGRARFVDGITRPVYLDGERQHVTDEGERVYGIFLIPDEDRCDAPVIVDTASHLSRSTDPAAETAGHRNRFQGKQIVPSKVRSKAWFKPG
jgi:hypothetical protein